MTGEHLAYDALNYILRGNYQKLQAAIATHGSWVAALKATEQTIDLSKREKILKENNIHLVLQSDPEFPEEFKQIPWPPMAFYYKGAFPAPKPRVAIVGTRKATSQGLAITFDFAKTLASWGIPVVSGLALGIDTKAHEGTLAGKGITIAVLACGLDTIYPQQNYQLAQKILKNQGALISEYAPGVPSYRNFFIERNRLTSGLADGVIIIEAPERSGALATARFAIEQNKEIGVVPGPVKNLNYTGSFKLLKSGAALITEPEEILSLLSIEKKQVMDRAKKQKFDKLEKNQKIVIAVMEKAGEPLHIDAIVAHAALDAALVAQTLGLLTVEGIIQEQNGYYFIG